MTDEHATDTPPAEPLSGLSRPARLVLGWGLFLAFVVLFAILALI
jgi:hypothetical protein